MEQKAVRVKGRLEWEPGERRFDGGAGVLARAVIPCSHKVAGREEFSGFSASRTGEDVRASIEPTSPQQRSPSRDEFTEP